MTGKRIVRSVTIAVAVAVILTACHIMVNGIGLCHDLDFGAGAYYYADIPEFDKIEKNAGFFTAVPVWVHIILFLVWGFFMYRLWCRVEDGKK